MKGTGERLRGRDRARTRAVGFFEVVSPVGVAVPVCLSKGASESRVRVEEVAAVVQAREVRKAYRNGAVVEALRGVDLDIGAGELVAVVGPSGSGTTTLLNCWSGLERIDAGRVVVDGAEHRPNALSGGEQKRVAVARAVVHDPAAVERRRIIGVLRALGYRRRQILTGLLAEKLTLATFGVVIGLVAGLTMGYLLLRVIVQGDGAVPFAVDLPEFAGMVLLVYASTAVVTVGPAVRAAALPPAQAARQLD